MVRIAHVGERTGTEEADCINDYEMQEAENTKITK